LTTALGKLLPAKVLEEAGLILRRGDGTHFDRFRNRIMFPVDTGPGKTAGFGARAIATEDQPKYLNSSESPVFRKSALLFGLPQARSAIRERKEILISEGYLDVLRLHAAGFTHAVATCGTALTLDHARALSRFEAEVLIVYDGDVAGIRAADRGLDPLLAVGLAVRVLLLPAGEDPDSYLAKQAPSEFGKLLKEARDVPGFLAEATLGGEGANPSLEARVRRFIGLLSRLEDPIRRRLLLRRGSEAFGLEEGVLLEALETRKSGGAPGRPILANRAGAGSPAAPPAAPRRENAPEGGAGPVPPPVVTVEQLDPAERELAARALTEEGAIRAIAEAGGTGCLPTEAVREVLGPWVEAGQPPLPEERDRLLAEEPLVRGILAIHPVEVAAPLEEQLRTARGLIERLEELRLRAALQVLDRAIRAAETARDGSLERLVAERRDLASKYHQRSTSTVL
jgi:DNA primase